jgi:genome maintenance exonuclease 1
MFIHNRVSLSDYSTENINDKRYYVTDKGKYPSVTTVLGEMLDKSFLDVWIKRVGIEEANRVKGRAARRGTALHSLCEDFICNKKTEGMIQPSNLLLFNQIKPILINHVNNIVSIEDVLLSHKLKLAGRVDLIAEYDGVLSIIDYKTSVYNKKEEDILGYLYQTSLYSYMFYEMTGKLPKQTVIIIGLEGEPNPQIFITKSSKYVSEAIDLVKKYHLTF